jgi:hypothetical protein
MNNHYPCYSHYCCLLNHHHYWKYPNHHKPRTDLDDHLGCNWIGGDCVREADDLRHLELQCVVDDKTVDESTNSAY